MPRQSSTPDADPDAAEPTAEPTSTDAESTDADTAYGDINEAMEATEPDDANRRNEYPPGSDELTADNVRRFPDLFTDEQKASIPTDELPETDIERQQREAAEAEAGE